MKYILCTVIYSFALSTTVFASPAIFGRQADAAAAASQPSDQDSTYKKDDELTRLLMQVSSQPLVDPPAPPSVPLIQAADGGAKDTSTAKVKRYGSQIMFHLEGNRNSSVPSCTADYPFFQDTLDAKDKNDLYWDVATWPKQPETPEGKEIGPTDGYFKVCSRGLALVMQCTGPGISDLDWNDMRTFGTWLHNYKDDDPDQGKVWKGIVYDKGDKNKLCCNLHTLPCWGDVEVAENAIPPIINNNEGTDAAATPNTAANGGGRRAKRAPPAGSITVTNTNGKIKLYVYTTTVKIATHVMVTLANQAYQTMLGEQPKRIAYLKVPAADTTTIAGMNPYGNQFSYLNTAETLLSRDELIKITRMIKDLSLVLTRDQTRQVRFDVYKDENLVGKIQWGGYLKQLRNCVFTSPTPAQPSSSSKLKQFFGCFLTVHDEP